MLSHMSAVEMVVAERGKRHAWENYSIKLEQMGLAMDTVKPDRFLFSVW